MTHTLLYVKCKGILRPVFYGCIPTHGASTDPQLSIQHQGHNSSVAWTISTQSPCLGSCSQGKTHSSHRAEAVGINIVRKVFFGKLQEVRGQELSQWQRRSAHPATARILNRRAVWRGVRGSNKTTQAQVTDKRQLELDQRWNRRGCLQGSSSWWRCPRRANSFVSSN